MILQLNIRKFVVLLFAVPGLVACTARMDIETKDSPLVPVIYGNITGETVHQFVRISSSSPYFEQDSTHLVEDADVRVLSSEGKEYVYKYYENGYYFSEHLFAAKAGETYKLTVRVDFNQDGTEEIYEAETTMQPAIELDSINIELIDFMGFNHFALNASWQDPQGVETYYLFKYSINDSVSNDAIDRFITVDDHMYDGAYLDKVTVTYFEDAEDEDVIRMHERSDDDGDRQDLVKSGDKILLQLINIEKGYYNFIRDCRRGKRGENPFFGGPPSNVYTNLTNGAVGYFTSYTWREASAVVP
ncbi:MAG: DUF4249 domain-containing protein [Tannerella sp.]|jgi:hypothetical protein|nr:DUF4249 domain-containing protein [Tannerella sp.]